MNRNEALQHRARIEAQDKPIGEHIDYALAVVKLRLNKVAREVEDIRKDALSGAGKAYIEGVSRIDRITKDTPPEDVAKILAVARAYDDENADGKALYESQEKAFQNSLAEDVDLPRYQGKAAWKNELKGQPASVIAWVLELIDIPDDEGTAG